MTEDIGLYNRQESLKLNIPKSATIIGVGGVGSWTALELALIGVEKIVLIDPDMIEKHNLNRTPFKLYHIGLPKVDAVQDLILERREIEVLAIKDVLENTPKSIYETECIIDCRDIAKKMPVKPHIVAGYDGLNMTFHTNPDFEALWGEGGVSYRVTPSFVVTPTILASLITAYITVPDLKTDKELIHSFNVPQMVKMAMGVKDE